MTRPSAAALLTVEEAREIAALIRLAELLCERAGQFGQVRLEHGFRGTPHHDSRECRRESVVMGATGQVQRT